MTEKFNEGVNTVESQVRHSVINERDTAESCPMDHVECDEGHIMEGAEGPEIMSMP